LVGENWHLGVREIKDDTLDWLTDDKVLETKPVKLADVLAEILSTLEKRRSKNEDAK
jgi:hypothetical protein